MFRIATYNLHFGGTDRAQLIAEVLKPLDADIVLLVEASDKQVLRELSGALGMVITDVHGKAHLAFLSKNAPVFWEASPPSPHDRPLLCAEFQGSGSQRIGVYGLHLQCHYFRWNEAQRLEEIEAYLRYIRAKPAMPHVLLGDFNAIAPGDRFDTDALPLKEKAMLWWERGKVYRDVITKLRQVGYVDCFRSKHPDADGYTIPVTHPHVRLDYIFADPLMAAFLQNCNVVSTPAALTASDHFPVVADFTLP